MITTWLILVSPLWAWRKEYPHSLWEAQGQDWGILEGVFGAYKELSSTFRVAPLP